MKGGAWESGEGESGKSGAQGSGNMKVGDIGVRKHERSGVGVGNVRPGTWESGA